jgi:magnesium transporter
MPWYELNSADDPKLNDLAERFHLHPLHIEDARSIDERTKVEQTPTYTFAVLKPVHFSGLLTADKSVSAIASKSSTTVNPVMFSPIDIFAGRGAAVKGEAGEPDQPGEPFFITIADPTCSASNEALARARRDGSDDKPARLLYLILDTVVDLYFPAIDYYDDRIDEIEDRVIADPSPEVLGQIFDLKRQLIDLRRVLVGTRDATLHLQRDPGSIVDDEHQPFVRDIYDHVVRLLDSVETQRDLVNNALDIYLSSVANRTNEVMKVLTLLGTMALPALAITGIYGMNLKGLPFETSPHGALYVALLTLLLTGLLVWVLRSRRWL